VRMIFTQGCIVSLILFVNYETMACNVFKLLNIVIGLVIIFGSSFIQIIGSQCALFVKKTSGLIAAPLLPVYQVSN
jgi:hypothetical protein